ncbi:MAG: flagellar protein FlgN [Planctomycetota bacterium]
MTTRTTSHASPDTLDDIADAMLPILREQIVMHEAMLKLIRQKRDSIRDADFGSLASLSRAEQKCASAMTTLEQQRLALLERAQPWFGTGEPTVSGLCDQLRHERGEEIRELAEELRTRLVNLRAESAVLRDAAMRLSGHLSGLVQTVQSAISRAKVYGKTGQLAMNASIDASLDLKT